MDNDVQELINFTKGLDYESYMNDLEVFNLRDNSLKLQSRH